LFQELTLWAAVTSKEQEKPLSIRIVDHVDGIGSPICPASTQIESADRTSRLGLSGPPAAADFVLSSGERWHFDRELFSLKMVLPVQGGSSKPFETPNTALLKVLPMPSMPMPLMIDSHLDLAMNMVYFDRDITLSLQAMNDAERHMTDVPFRGRATVTLPEMRRTGIALCIATLLARSGPSHQRPTGYNRADIDFGTQTAAWCSCHTQLAYYRLLESWGEIRLIRSVQQMREHWQQWESAEDYRQLPIGVILSIEGADPLLTPEFAEHFFLEGVRAIGLAHYGHSHYASGTRVEGPITEKGIELLRRMQDLGIALDVTHLCDESMAQAFDLFEGQIWASHHNCRSLVNWDRQLTDDQIRQLVRRDGVIGVAMDAIMLYDGWIYRETSPEVVDLEAAIDQLDHVCQIAGNTRHIGIGTDLDGGFGTEQTPRDLKSIADVRTLASRMERRGYTQDDINAFFHGNWLRKLEAVLPDHSASEERPFQVMGRHTSV
jgi:membrane dipeptidase